MGLTGTECRVHHREIFRRDSLYTQIWVTLRSHQIWGTPSVLASKEVIGRPWVLKIGLGGGPIGGTATPTGQLDGTLTVHAKPLREPHGKRLGCEWPRP